MKYLLMVMMVFVWCFASGQNTQTPEQIRQEMAKIRQTTNWEDPAAAAKANEQIKALAKLLMTANAAPGMPAQTEQGSANHPNDARKMNELNQEMIEQRMDIWNQIWKSAAVGKNADILLAEPLQKKIVKEFQEEEMPGSEAFMEENTLLFLDMSMPGVQGIIDVMENFKSIRTLIISGGTYGVPVNLNDILNRAVAYPLEELYIINFKGFVTSVPQKTGSFSGLKYLALYNNQIKQLPDEIGNLYALKELYVEMNPITSLFPVIAQLTQLEILGVLQTGIPDSELEKIRQLLPNCKIEEP